MSIFGIIPLAGNASRMKNIPKFLLPCGDGVSLLDNSVKVFHDNKIHNIIAGLSSINFELLQNNKDLHKILVNTKTMAETVYHVVNEVNKDDSDKNIMIMPDTYFIIKNEVKDMIHMLDSYDIVVLLWKLKDYQKGKVGQCKILDNFVIDVQDKNIHCDYEHFWGMVGWNAKLNKYIDPAWPTIGNLINKALELHIKIGYVICDSNYYDCGTYSEYFKFIKTEI